MRSEKEIKEENKIKIEVTKS